MTEGVKPITGNMRKIADTTNTSGDVQDIYSGWAKQYEVDMDPTAFYHGPFQVAKHLHEIYPNKAARLLDIGAGTGLLGVELHSRGFTNIDALDANENMLNESRTRNVYTNYIVAFLGKNRLNIENDTYDVVIGCGVFVPGHVTEDCFDELCRITKPGGLIIISSNEKYAWEDAGFYLEKIRAAAKRYEDSGIWTIESHKFVPHLGNFRGSTTTVRLPEN